MVKKFGFWIALLFLILALTSSVFYLYTKSKKVYPNEVISSVSKSFKSDLKKFLNLSRISAEQLKEDAQEVDIDDLPIGSLNQYFSKFISSDKFLQGVVIFGNSMNYVIYQDNDSWVTTHNMLNDSLVKWTRLDNNLNETGNWLDTYNFFMEQKELDVLKVGNLKPGEFVWRTAQSQRQTRQDKDLFFVIFMLNDKSTSDRAALMYRTTDLDKKFSSVMNYETPLVTILTGRNNVVTPIRTDDTLLVKKVEQVLPEVNKAFLDWKKTQPDSAATISFIASNTEFWIGMDTINPILGAHSYGITISQPDLIANKKKLDEIFLYLAIAFFIFALAGFLPVYREHQKLKSISIKKIKPLQGEELLKLIKRGETEFVEFKSSLRWDFMEEKPNKILENVILKSIAAFSNAKGGTLFIGVTDDMEIIGLENDFKTLKKQDADYFELHLRKLINNQFGIHFANNHLHIHFPEFDEKIICVIYILTSDKPLYLKTKNKQAQDVEKFYVRTGNASHEITSLKEIHEYIASHFKKE
jgi:hypothetical protein